MNTRIRSIQIASYIFYAVMIIVILVSQSALIGLICSILMCFSAIFWFGFWCATQRVIVHPSIAMSLGVMSFFLMLTAFTRLLELHEIITY